MQTAVASTPMRLIDLLNDVFQCFDDLVEKYDLEKIKMIGDCCRGTAITRSRQGDRKFSPRYAGGGNRRKFGDRKLAFRTGINSGPVVPGVIGRKKFICDLWGDAVNIARRTERWAGPVFRFEWQGG